jgi:hypothetical protein
VFNIFLPWLQHGEIMHSLQSATANIIRGKTGAKPSGVGLTARLALDAKTREDAYAIRHASYLSGGFIDPMPDGLFRDADDMKPNSRSVVVYRLGRPVASVRLCVLDQGAARSGWSEIPASRIFPEAVAELAASLPHDRPARLTEINRLVRHPDFANDAQLVFALFRIVGFLVADGKSDMTLSCVRRNHTPFYRRLHFDYVAGPRRYAGVKFETNLMACMRSRYDSVAKDIPFLGAAAGPQSAYAGLLHGENITIFQEG